MLSSNLNNKTQCLPETAERVNLLLKGGFSWREDHLLVLDNRQVPEYEIYLSFTRTQEIAHAIRAGIITDSDVIVKACCCGIYLAALRKQDTRNWQQALKADFEVLYKVVRDQPECVAVLDEARGWVMQTIATPEGTGSLLDRLRNQVDQLCV